MKLASRPGKAKGAYYTPREIVDYMGKESLKAYLLSDPDKANDKSYKQAVETLIDTSDVDWIGTDGKHSTPRDRVMRYRQDIQEQLNQVKIFDPACGSGAFPIGMLHLMLSAYERLEGGRDFNRYETKKRILKQNLFGADIDPLAVDISRLRAWLSLEVDREQQAEQKEVLPNLDFKFVLANSLLKLESDGTQNLFDQKHKDQIKQLEEIRRQWFDPIESRKDAHNASTQEIRDKIKAKFNAKKKEITDSLDSDNQDIYRQATKLLQWDPFDHNAFESDDSSKWWFDPKWMLGVEDGFDIVIGNPPYGAKQPPKTVQVLSKQYIATGRNGLRGTKDTYALFIELGIELLKSSGNLIYIVPISITCNDKNASLYDLMEKRSGRIMISSYAVSPKPIFTASDVNTSIIMLTRSSTPPPRY